MTVRRRRSDRSGRSKLHSPGRPDSARREELVRFWAAIATGRSSEDAARDAGVSPPVGSRWFRRSGGMPPSHLSQSAKPLSGRYLSFEEREENALLRAQGRGIRHIACRLERAPSTISREVRRNAATRSGGLDYRATTAQWHADRSAKRPKPAKLATNEALRRYVQDRLAGRISAPDGTVIEGPRVVWNGRRHGPRQHRRWARAWSPEQIACAAAAALSEESGRATKFEPPVVSSGNLTPFGKGGRSVEFEILAAAKMTFLVKMVVNRSVDRNELL